jgi:hypothetical protein
VFLHETVFVNIIFNAIIQGWRGVKSIQIDAIIFNITPKSLNENIVQRSTFPVHTNLYLVDFQYVSEVNRRKLTSLVTIENIRL